MRRSSAWRSSTSSGWSSSSARGGHRDDLLGEHVERVARDDGRLDQALAHALGDDRALEQVGAELGEDAALGGVADVVAGAADALQAAGDRLRRLDLQHEVDGAHVDAELEARGGDQARQLAGLELVLDHEPLLARQRAVVGAGDLDGGPVRVVVGGELVEPQREPLGAAAVVDEHDRRLCCADQLEDLAGRSPARSTCASPRAPANGSSSTSDCSGSTMLSTGTWILRSSGLRTPASTTRQVRFGPTMKRPTSSSGFCVADRPIRWTGPSAACVEPLERDRQVRAALGLRDGVDLVDDHRLGAGEDLARLAREHQVQRLGRGDQDVRRVARHVAPVLLRRVAGADADADVGADPAQRRAQVLLDVVGERLQRRDVDEPGAVRRDGSATSRSSPHRNAASVLPEPVGAEISVCSPVAIAGQACACAGGRLREGARRTSRGPGG